jgi:putative pyruvate formate lyase activating enzyme
MTDTLKVARAALHMWEEPVISGERGSGAVFFSGCPLRCVFCQNHNIAIGSCGKEISVERLVEIFFELKEKGANNINLVTPTHYIPQVKLALEQAKREHLNLPIVYNTGSYENVEALKALEGLIDIYLPDFKYFDSNISRKYAKAPDYFQKAAAAIEEMYRQAGKPVFYKEGTSYEEAEYTGEEEHILMRKGVIIRHLILPGCKEDSKKVLKYVHETYGEKVYLSIMNQYTPLSTSNAYEELQRKVTEEEYEEVVDFAIDLGVENGFIQEGDTAEESFIPEFDNEGV